MDLKEYKKVLEEENKKGNKADYKRIEEAKNQLLNDENNLEETSRLFFSLENHTIEYSIKKIDEYISKNEVKKVVLDDQNTNNKSERIKLFIIISLIIVLLIIIFLCVLILFQNKILK